MESGKPATRQKATASSPGGHRSAGLVGPIGPVGPAVPRGRTLGIVPPHGRQHGVDSGDRGAHRWHRGARQLGHRPRQRTGRPDPGGDRRPRAAGGAAAGEPPCGLPRSDRTGPHDGRVVLGDLRRAATARLRRAHRSAHRTARPGDRRVREDPSLRPRRRAGGPAPAAAAALALQKKTGPFFSALQAELSGEADGRTDFDDAYHPFWKALENFVDAARDAHQGHGG